MGDKLDCVVIGAGVVGLAIARSLAIAGRDVVVLEAESQFGVHTSSRNSEVIHAGIYYPEDSLKARLCVDGKERLYRYCDRHHVNHSRMGKLIVATSEAEIARLEAIKAQAEKNGVDDLRFLDAEDVQRKEPSVRCAHALLSPSTGVVDSHGFMMSLIAEIEAHRGYIVANSCVMDVQPDGRSFELTVSGTGGKTFVCRTLVNAAGLRAHDLAKKMTMATPLAANMRVPAVHYAKAHYFAYSGKSPFQHLIYPVPVDGGLGIHATNDLAGAARFGPDVSWVDEVDYTFDESRKQDFVTAIRQYFPTVEPDKLVPGYTGIRPKLSGPGEAPADFAIQGEQEHGVPGLVNLFGIESPGLTASLSIAARVRDMLFGHR